MSQTPTLEVLSFTGIGAGNFIDLPAAAAQGITVCNCPGYSDNTVAEHTFALLLATARHLPRLDAGLREGRWNQSLLGAELRGKRLGLVGRGDRVVFIGGSPAGVAGATNFVRVDEIR